MRINRWALEAQVSFFMDFVNQIKESPIEAAKQQIGPVLRNSLQYYGKSYIEGRPELKDLFSRMEKFIDDKSATVDDFCELTIEKNQLEYLPLIQDTCNFIEPYLEKQDSPFNISFKKLKSRAKDQGIDTSNNNWLFGYLNQVPIITMYILSINAAIRFQGEHPDCIVINDFNNKFIRSYLSPLIINSAFPDKKPENFFAYSEDFRTNPEAKTSFAPPYDNVSISANIIELCKFWAGQPLKVYAVPAELLNVPNEQLKRFTHEFAISVSDFIFFHELSHILLGHQPRNASKSDEVNADILALNILTDSCLDYNEHLLKTKEHDLGLGFTFRTIGPPILMYIFSIIDVLTKSENILHPYAPLRNFYLKFTNHMKFMKPTMLCHTYKCLWEYYEGIFESALEKLGVTMDVIREKNDDIELKMTTAKIREDLI